MKKVVLFVVVISLVFLTGCGKKMESVTKDEVKFQKEYENLNGKKQGDKKNLEVSIPDSNKMKYINSDEVISILEKKTGVIYFGFPNCPWCRNAVPVLIDAAIDSGLDSIYYANLLEERDTKKLDDEGQIVTEKEGSEAYYKIVDLLKDSLGVYEGLDDDSVKRLYFPTVVFVKNGKVEAVHIGTVDSQKDPYKELNSKEKEQLKDIYVKAITKIQNLTCDTDKTC